MTWADAVAGPLSGATCLWQDLDGLHVAAAPAAAPPTSILWAWRDDTGGSGGSVLVRLRLDGDIAYVAVHAPGNSADAEAMRTVPWAVGPKGDGRVAGARAADDCDPARGVGAEYEQVVVDGNGDGTGTITFIRPAESRASARGSDE